MKPILSEFITVLRSQGIAIGLDTLEDISELFRVLPENTPQLRLKTTLCSIVAKNEEEQRLFCEIFDQYFYTTGNTVEKNQLNPTSSNECSKEEVPGPRTKQRRKYPYVSIAAASLILLMTISILMPDWNSFWGSVMQEKEEPEIPVDTPEDKGEVTQSVQDSLTEKARPLISEEVGMVSPQFHSYQKLSLPDLSPWVAPESWWEYNWIYIQYGSTVLGLLIGISLYYRSSTNYRVSRYQRTIPPWSWPIKVNQPPALLWSDHVQRGAMQMKKKVASGYQFWSPEKSVAASSLTGGAIQIVYEDQLVDARYLILIDLKSSNNHQSLWFENLFQHISKQEVEVDRFYFEGDPEWCWNDDYPNGIDLASLNQLFREYRLLIFWAGERMVNFATGELEEWTRVLNDWGNGAALLTPKPIGEWGARELLIAQVLVIMPATTEGMATVIDHFNRQVGQPRLNQQKPDQYLSLKGDPLQVKLRLRDFLGEPRTDLPTVYDWLCACCIYPQLTWEMTLYLGEALSDPKNTLLTEENMFKLTRLSWFQEGRIPDAFRATLLEDLSPNIREKSATAIVSLLEDNLPSDITARPYQERKMHIAINKLLIEKNWRKRRQLRKELKRSKQQKIAKDHIALDYVGQHASGMAFPIPREVASLLFNEGNTILGVRPILKMLMIMMFFASPWLMNSVFQTCDLTYLNYYEGTRYCLSSEESQSTFARFQRIKEYNEYVTFGRDVPFTMADAVKNVITSDSNQSLFQRNVAARLFNEGRYEESAIVLKKLLDLEPDDNILWDRLGLAYFFSEQQNRQFEFLKARQITQQIDASYFDAMEVQTTRSALRSFELRFLYESIDLPFDGLRLARSKATQLYGYLDRDYHEVIEFQYETARSFNQGKAMVSVGGDYWLIDKLGNRLEEFEKIYPSSNGLHLARKMSKYGFLDMNGQEVISFQYDSASSFFDGSAYADGSFIDVQGKSIDDQNGFQTAKLRMEADSLYSVDKLGASKALYQQILGLVDDVSIQDRIKLIEKKLSGQKRTDGNTGPVPISPSGISVMKRPIAYEEPRLALSFSDFKPLKDFSNEAWSVWCDREGVVSSNGSKLQFMGKYWVINEDQNRLHVAEYNPSKYNFGLDEFREALLDYGWVNKKDLLLWSEALKSDETAFRMKALLVTNPYVLINALGKERFDSPLFSFYGSPYTSQVSLTTSPPFTIFYVFKEENDRLLLGKSTDLSYNNNQDHVLGWVDKHAVSFWNHRLAIEPNWDQRAVRERESAGILPSVFEIPTEAAQYQVGQISNSKALWTREYTRREISRWMRFPVFESSENILKVGVVSGVMIDDDPMVETISSEQYAIYLDRYDEKRTETRNINVVLVVDATRSMGPYIDATRDAVRRAMEKLSLSANSFSFGVVGYPDFEEEEGRRFEVWPINANKNTVYENLTVLQAFHDQDRSQSEAVFSGLKEAVKLFQLKESSNKQTNAIIVIGDAGSDYNSLLESQSLEAVREVLVSHNISLLSIQAHRNEHPAYDDFIFQIKDLIEETASDIIGSNNRRLPNVLSFDTVVSLTQKEQNTYRLKVGKATVDGGVQYARLGAFIEPEQVGQEIVSLIEDLDARNNDLMNAMEKFLNSVQVDQGNEEVTPEMAEFLLEAGFDEDMILQLISKRYQIMFEAYAPLRVNELKNDLFKYVLFMDNQELDEMLEELIKLVNIEGTGYRKREQLADVWLSILSSYTDIETQDLERMPVSELLSVITGMPSNSPLLQQTTLLDILDKSKLSDQELNALLTNISSKVEELRGINGDPEFYFLSNDQRFYWIPQEYLP